MTDSQQLLADYVNTGSETAFRELVSRYVDLVYSAAVRLVNGDRQLAEDVTQTVFVDLARLARTLSRDVMLGGWLHRHTCFVASTALRSERRRQNRERQAVEMNALEEPSPADLQSVAPLLDDAINQLGAEDRTAILLRYFEQRDFRSVGEVLGSNEDAARKRVGRALEKLHSSLTKRGVTLSAAALATLMAAQAVTAAPAGLAVSVSTVAITGAATGSATALTLLKIMSTTKLQIGILTAVVAAIAIPLVMEHQEKIKLRQENMTLRQQAARMDQLTAENQRLTKLVAQTTATSTAPTNESSRELLKLRGEVGRLRLENSAAPKTSPAAISGMISSPEMFKVIRDQQKRGMAKIYGDFTNRMNMTPEQAEKLSDLLADNVMENINRATEVLRDGKTPEQMNEVFAGQDAALRQQLQTLLGPEGAAQYEEYTHDLASLLTAEQFKDKLTGEGPAKEEKSKQIYQLMQEEIQLELARAGLGPDYQPVPMLNFRNIVSEDEAEKSLKHLESIYNNVAARAASFLSPEELERFKEFRSVALNANRATLLVNRKMMAPSTK
jgi:RNA polymerase sigma factor (sigma-70 family)